MPYPQISISFWTLFHSFLRDEAGPEGEHARAKGACAWMTAELTTLRRCCTPDEADLLGDVHEAWRVMGHKEAPAYALIKHQIFTGSDPAKEELLREYEDLAPELPRLHVEDLPAILATKITESHETRVALTLKNSLKIIVDGAEVKDPSTGRKEKQKGVTDAMRYLMTRMDAGFGMPPTTPTHGVFTESQNHVRKIYEEIADPNITKGRVIPTGIAPVDKAIKARKGQFVGILGFAGSGKTRFGRTWVYNAVRLGFHVLHFSLEQTFDEEIVRYAIIHSNQPFWGKDAHGNSRGINIKDFEDGNLNAAQRDFLFNECRKDVEQHLNLPGRLSIRQPSAGNTWDSIKALTSVTDRVYPLDMVFIDDMSLVTPKSQRHAIEETNANIQDAKTFAMTFNDAEGLLVATPVQGSRAGYDAAQKAHGRWDMSGVYMYSQFDKALDICYSVYSDDDLDAESAVVLGSAKHRRGKNLFPTKVAVNHACGTYLEMNTSPEDWDRNMRDALELL